MAAIGIALPAHGSRASPCALVPSVELCCGVCSRARGDPALPWPPLVLGTLLGPCVPFRAGVEASGLTHLTGRASLNVLSISSRVGHWRGHTQTPTPTPGYTGSVVGVSGSCCPVMSWEDPERPQEKKRLPARPAKANTPKCRESSPSLPCCSLAVGCRVEVVMVMGTHPAGLSEEGAGGGVGCFFPTRISSCQSALARGERIPYMTEKNAISKNNKTSYSYLLILGKWMNSSLLQIFFLS